MQIVTRKTQLAVQALTWLASRGEGVHNVKNIADAIAVSPTSLTKVLQSLARVGYVQGTRGIGGGYSFAQVPPTASLYDLAVYMGEEERLNNRCFLGQDVCDADHPCAVHLHWEGYRHELLEFMRTTALVKLIEGQRLIKV